MYIKYVLIKKFKSYRELAYMEELDPAVNLVIGANGHGKSNFLDAIIFVLTDKYSNLRQEDKKLLVHEEPGEEITQISVELILDNKSRRFPIDKDTINIVKIYHVNENKEEILINQKKLLKADVYNILESAGFCKQNPYYIIQQGKINTIINMNEFELFEIFSEVTGTKIYEEKKLESMKLLDEASENRNKIVRQSNDIDTYISRLQSQCKDLESFANLEIKKKACEYVIYNEKVADFQTNIDLLEVRKAEQSTTLQSLYFSLNQNKEKMSEKLLIQTRYNKIVEAIKNKITRCSDEINLIMQSTMKDEASLRMINEKNQSYNENKQEIEVELAGLREEKIRMNTELARVIEKLNDIEREISTTRHHYDELNNKNELIILSNGSEVDKRNFLNNEIAKLSNMKEDINNKILQLDSSIKQDEEQYASLKSHIEINDSRLLTSELKNIVNRINELKNTRVDIVNNIKKLDLDLNELNSENEISKENIKGVERLIPNKDILNAVLNIKYQNIPGCYGILMDLIEVDKKFRNSVDIIAKDKLYSLIVRDYETAEKVLEINKSMNGPVITILPLDWNTKVTKYNYPTSDSVPLIKQIKVKESELSHEELEPILNKLFGKSLLVKNYEFGMKFAKQYHLNCITPENEIIYSDALVTKVGYYDYRKQRLNLYDQLAENKEKIYNFEIKKKSFEIQRNRLLNEETKILREIQALMSTKNDLSFKLSEANKQNQTISEELLNLSELINSKKEVLDKNFNDKNILEQRINNYYNMINKKDYSQMNLNFSEINNEKNKIEKKLIDLEKAKNYISQQKINLESKYNDVLLKRENELRSKLQQIDLNKHDGLSQTFDFTEEKAVINEMQNNVNHIKDLEAIAKKSKEDKAKIEKELDLISNEINLVKNEQNKINDKIGKEENEMKEILLILQSISDKKTVLLKSIGNLGQVKSNEIESINKLKEAQIRLLQNESGIDIRETDQRQQMLLKPIYEKLDKINHKMKRFEKINRFALDDYNLFKKKKEEVSEKLNDLKEKEEEIMQVIRTLDEKKETAINTTFDKVKNSFEYFFKELVPNGYGNLILDSNKNGKAIYISVSFSGVSNQAMHQLSGGQKTAVAVGLIFALSKVDPPPFYILDEIDAALDPHMRNNLAKLIANLSEHNQYIISTFKPEILDVANNIYQVKFVNKTSNLNKITKDQANKFIKDINL